MSNWATAMRKIYKTWPQSKGYHPIFISALHHFYFSVPEIDSINLTPVFKPKSETSISDTSEITAQTKLSNPDTLGEDYSKLEKIQDHVASLQQIYGMKGVKRPDLKGKGR
jgi:galactose mutarotase-like enzyme